MRRGSDMSEPVFYRVRHATEPPSGLLDAAHPAWAVSDEIAWGPPRFETLFRALWTPETLAIRFAVRDDAPWHTMRKRDDHLWEEEVVEIFLDPSRSGHGYAELEISPANVVCDVRMQSPWPDKHMDLAWDFVGLSTVVAPWRERDGLVGWMATATMPWSDFASLPARAQLPPAPGDRWRFNVFRIKRPGGPGDPEAGVLYLAWSPNPSPSFHYPDAFRDFVFDR